MHFKQNHFIIWKMWKTNVLFCGDLHTIVLTYGQWYSLSYGYGWVIALGYSNFHKRYLEMVTKKKVCKEKVENNWLEGGWIFIEKYFRG